MTTQSLTPTNNEELAALMEQVVLGGDLAGLTSSQRVAYYHRVCESLRLNPLTKPFAYLKLKDGNTEKTVLYATRDCTDQLRTRDAISLTIIDRQVVEGVYVVTARGTTPDGRTDEATGAVPLMRENGTWSGGEGHRRFQADGTFTPLNPEARANAMMKAETKAKRRVTLSICGLGWLDETETETIPGAQVMADVEPGEPRPSRRQPPAGRDPQAIIDQGRAAAAAEGGEMDFTAFWKAAKSMAFGSPDAVQQAIGIDVRQPGVDLADVLRKLEAKFSA